MNKFLMTAALAGLCAAGAQSVSVSVAPPASLDLGISAGYAGGLSGALSLTARNLGGTNIGLRGSVAYTNLPDSLNDAESTVLGVPSTGLTSVGGQKNDAIYGATEGGRNLTLGLDGLFHLGYNANTGIGANVYAGLRYNLFQGTLTYPDGQVYSVRSNQLGLGGGVVAFYPIAGNVFLTGDLGVDHFFNAPITVNNSNSNAGAVTAAPGSANYAQADSLANQPKTVLKAKVGLSVRF